MRRTRPLQMSRPETIGKTVMTASKFISNYAYTTRATQHLVASPCIAICTINAKNKLCDGCLRTLDEIAEWSDMDNVAKREVWVLIAQRAAAAGSQPPALQTP